MRRPIRYRRPVSAFLYIHGPDVFGAGCLVAAVLSGVADFVLIPDGFTRFVVAVIAAAV